MAAKPEVLLSSGHNVVLVLDYGSQYTQLIARRVREIGLLSILLPGDDNMVSRGGARAPHRAPTGPPGCCGKAPDRANSAACSAAPYPAPRGPSSAPAGPTPARAIA